MLISTKFDGYSRDGLRRLFKGDASGGKYDSLETLYKEQADSARLLREQAEKNLPGAVDSYVAQTDRVLDPGYAESQANMAATDIAGANAKEQAAVTRNLQSMGVNPNDTRFVGSLRTTGLNTAARLAAGKNAARTASQNYQLNVAKDKVGTFTGQSNQAASQMGAAASGLGSVYSAQANQNAAQGAQQANAVGSLVGAGIAGYGLYNQKRDGGRIVAPCGLKRVERHMMGGGVGSQQNTGFFQMGAIAPPPSAQKPQGDPVGAALGTANQINGLYKAGAALGKKAATDTAANGAGQAATQAAGDAAAAAATDKAVEAAGEVALEKGAEAAAGSAVEAGASSALAGGAGAAMGAVSTALPWVGAAYAAGKLLDMWNSGGEVGTQHQGMTEAEAEARFAAAEKDGNVQDIREGGKVPGEWKGNTDNVPALLTEDEHVVNAEAAAMIGHDKLEELNKKGLALRAKGYTPGRIRAGRGLKKEAA